MLLAYPDGLWLDREQAVTPYLAPVARLGAASLLVLPIVWQNDVVGTVVLGFATAVILTDEERGRARNLGDRVGVAFATAAKDEQLYFQANYDPLTALPNRLYFMDQLARRLVQAQREPRQFALLVIDLDHFKLINDTLGPRSGRRCVAPDRRAAAAMRARDRYRGAARRRRIHDRPAAHQVGARLGVRRAAHHRDRWPRRSSSAARSSYLNASIGIALHPADGMTAEELLRNADTAMYRAKEGGRGRYVYFEERMNVAALARVSLERELRLAIERSEFSLWYQPQLDLRTGRISGAEALLRWDCPGRAYAHAGGFHPPRGRDGTHRADRRMGAARSLPAISRLADAEGLALPLVAINVSLRQFRQAGFVDQVRAILRSTGMAPAITRARDHRGAVARNEQRRVGDARTHARNGRDASRSTILAPATPRLHRSSGFRCRR